MTADRAGSYFLGALLGLLGLILLYQLYNFLAVTVLIAPLSFELDYGEGIVWQQALAILGHGAYGPIDQFPAIVFHYPPVYHLTTRAVAAAFGCDMLLAGRAVSRGATLAMVVFAALAIAQTATSRSWRHFAVAGLAGLILPTIWAIDFWSRLMRVDMLAMALSLAGLAFGLIAYTRPRWIYAAAGCFVAAVYAKQTSLPAPAALFAVMLWLRPQTAIKGIATCVVAGLIILVTGILLTDGGFFRHLFLYNVNRVDWSRVNLSIDQIRNEGLLVGAALAATIYLVRAVAIPIRDGRAAGATVRGALASNSAASARVTLLTYAAIGALTPVMMVKLGSSLNYLIEFFVTCTLLIGAALVVITQDVFERHTEPRDVLGTAFGIMLAGLLIVHAGRYETKWPTENYIIQQERNQDALIALMKPATKPIIADPMVALLRSGKPVLWESAIFAELGSIGTWDQRPFLAMIRNHEFAMFVTEGYGGERYPSPLAEAIAAEYPVTQSIGKWVVHSPRLNTDRSTKPTISQQP